MEPSDLKIASEIKPLNWHDRPEYIKSKINDAFQLICSDTFSKWGWLNGSNQYYLGGLDEHEWVKKNIIQSLPKQKEFYILDIGAGNFQWGKNFVEFLNQQTDIKDDIKIHVIGVRGEAYEGEPITKIGKCVLHNLGGFKIEEIESELKKRGLDLDKKVNFVSSRYCFHHLVEPLGTLAQTYNLLCPETGLLCMDAFYYIESDSNFKSCGNRHLQDMRIALILNAIGSSFLIQRDAGSEFDHLIIRRNDDKPCKLLAGYSGIECNDHIGAHLKVTSNCITKFYFDKNFASILKTKKIQFPDDRNYIYGDESLYNSIKEKVSSFGESRKWKNIFIDKTSQPDLDLSDPTMIALKMAKDWMQKVDELKKNYSSTQQTILIQEFSRVMGALKAIAEKSEKVNKAIEDMETFFNDALIL